MGGAWGVVAAAMLAVAFVAMNPSPAHACSCAELPPAAEALGDSAAVFSGTVVATRTLGDDVTGDLVARVAVEEVFGGDVSEVVEVTTAANSGLCGLGFSEGDRWLFYADQRDDGSLATHDCTRSSVLAYAAEGWEASGSAERDLEQLGAGRDPLAGQQLRSGAGPRAFVIGTIVLAVAVLLGLTALLVRRYGRHTAG